MAKTSNRWVIRRTALTWYPITSRYFCTSRKQRFSSPEDAVTATVTNVTKTKFWRCRNRSGKQTQMMVLHQNLLSSVMLKKYQMPEMHVVIYV